MTAFKVPVVETCATIGPRSTVAVRNETASSWPVVITKNPDTPRIAKATAAATIQFLRVMLVPFWIDTHTTIVLGF